MNEKAHQSVGDAPAQAQVVPTPHLVDLAVSLFGPEHGVELVISDRTEARSLVSCQVLMDG
jgi:hypothetical protein